jgi:hypothetical protein
MLKRKLLFQLLSLTIYPFAIATISIAPLLRPQVARLRRKLEDALL